MTLTANELSGDPELITRDFTSIKSKVYVRRIPRYPRASSLYKECMRKLVILNMCNIEETEYVGFSNTIVFDIGKAVHYWAQNTPSFISNDLRSGFWLCRGCGYTTVFGKTVSTNCPVCGAKKKAFEYKEYSLRLEKPMFITGHPDMFVEKPDKNYRVVEFKTINEAGFDSLKAPLIEHQWQIQTYMWGLSKDKLAKEIAFDSKIGYIMYISKALKVKSSPVKTFLVKRDKIILNDIKSKLNEFKEGFLNKKLPRIISLCEDSCYSSYISKKCPVIDICKKYVDN